MIPVAEAQARILALAAALPVEEVGLVEAAGRWAAADVLARRTQPVADLSAMDGYAIRAADLPGPWRVIGESAAGQGLTRAAGPGEAARIFTGAPLPTGTDTILIQENATRDGEVLRLAGPAPASGQSVRRQGSDFAAGTRLIAAGERLTAARIALAAIGGHGTLPVRRRVRVALLSTGNELVAPGTEAAGVALPASNAPMLAAMLADRPVTVADHGIVPDRLEAMAAALSRAAETADVVVTTGGASVGDHDLVRPALASLGAETDFWKVAMRPGKPLMAARLGTAILLGLPGNPVSAFVTARLFLLPLLDHLAGHPQPLPATTHAPLTQPMAAVGGRMDYVRAVREPGGVRALTEQDSAGLTALARSDLLIVRPAGATAAAAGTLVEVISVA